MSGIDANALLVLHGDPGFRDASLYDRAPTVYGSAALDEANYKFPSAGLKFVRTPASGVVFANDGAFDFGSGDFTIETWAYVSALDGTYKHLLARYSFGYPIPIFFLRVASSGQLQFAAYNDAGTAFLNLITAGACPVGVWFHVAAERFGATARLFVDGAIVATDASISAGPVTLGAVNIPLTVGGPSDAGLVSVTEGFNGWLDEVRISNVARYGGAAFTPATAQFTRSGLSYAALRAIFAQETDEQFAALLTIEHPDLVMDDFPAGLVRFTDDAADVTSRGDMYMAFPFTVDMPPQEGDRPPRVRLVIDNVDRRIVRGLRMIATPATATLEIVLASSPDTVEAGPFTMTLTSADYDVLSIEGDLAYEDVLNEPFPGDKYTPSNYAGLF